LFRSSRRSDPGSCDLAVAASNRVAMAYLLPGARITAAGVADRLAGLESSDVVAFREGDRFVVRRAGGELRFRRGQGTADLRGGTWQTEGEAGLLDPDTYPNALERLEGVLTCPTAGDVIVAAAAGWG